MSKCFSILIVLLAAACGNEIAPGRADQETDEPDSDLAVEFVDNRICRDCHEEEFQLWLGSHHEKAMQPANEETVLGNFDEASFTHFGVTSRFFRRDGKFFVRTEGPDGKMADFEILYTFGVEPLQQYLIAFPGGRLQCLTISWDTEQGRWFHLYPDERILPNDPLHWTGRYQNWNLMCAECHTTNLIKGYDRSTDSYQTTFDEINVSCQACHGPGSAHVKWANEYESDSNPPAENGLPVDFVRGDSAVQVDSCAPCHSRRSRLTDQYSHYGAYLDHFRVQSLSEGLYYPDGQILDEVYVYGSFLQSKMHRQGVRCSDCHNPHSLELAAEGNELCTRCHQDSPRGDFPTLRGALYDSDEHHYHPQGSDGARCVSCHMPERTYMVVDPRRDHSFRSPRPDLSAKLGVPNACTQCHEDQTDEWAADRVREWYGRDRAKHFAEAIDLGREGGEGAVQALSEVAVDESQAGIVRATALELLGSLEEPGLSPLRMGVQSDDPIVRLYAARGLGLLEPRKRLELAAPLLQDPLKAVRVEAARVLTAVSSQLFSQRERRIFSSVLRELELVEFSNADMPSSHLNLGILYTWQGNLSAAEKSYRKAIEMDPTLLPAKVNLANLLNRQGRNESAEKILRELIAEDEGHGEVHYSLGLLLAEMGRLEEAARVLATAAVLVPNRARIRYNYALTLQHLGQRSEAEAAMLEAHRIDSSDPDIVYALVVLYMQQESWDEALSFAHRLEGLIPGGPAQHLIAEIRNRARIANQSRVSGVE